jgi:hypothetical protein
MMRQVCLFGIANVISSTRVDQFMKCQEMETTDEGYLKQFNTNECTTIGGDSVVVENEKEVTLWFI